MHARVENPTPTVQLPRWLASKRIESVELCTVYTEFVLAITEIPVLWYTSPSNLL